MVVRTATVLFSDLVDSTGVLARAGQDRLERYRRQHFATAHESVAAQGGQVVKTLGDGVMAVFDSAAGAVVAAQLLRGQTVRQQKTKADALDVRIGIATGDVNVEDGDYFGAAVVQASRLCSGADPNQILVTDIVRVLASDRDGVHFGPVADYTLKGFDVPISACEVLGDPDDAVDGATTPFVGRDRELAALCSALSMAISGSLAFVLVSGEPGIGKTALVEEFAGDASELGTTVHWGRGWEDGDAPPLWMWSQLLRSASEILSPTDVVRSLLDSETSVEPDEVLPRDDAQLMQFDALAEFLAAVSRKSPLVLVLDDLQWADSASLAFVRFLAQGRRPCRILIVATYRDTEPERPQLREALAALARAQHIVHVPLKGLDVEEAALVVNAGLGRAADDDAVTALHHGTNGNPFFITQIVRLQRELGFDEAPSSALPVPRTLAEVVNRRLAMLPAGCIDVLEVAAVIGRDFRLEQLGVLTRLADVPLVPLLDALERFRILTPADGIASWTFTHDVLRSTVLTGIGGARQASLHLEIAEAFVALRAQGVPVDVEALALHFARSGTASGRREGSAYAVEAAVRAQALFAHEDAARQYALALELSGDQVSTDERLALRVAEGNERYLAGDGEGGRAAALDAAAARASERRPRRARPCRVRAVASRLSLDARSGSHCDRRGSDCRPPRRRHPGEGVSRSAARDGVLLLGSRSSTSAQRGRRSSRPSAR